MLQADDDLPSGDSIASATLSAGVSLAERFDSDRTRASKIGEPTGLASRQRGARESD